MLAALLAKRGRHRRGIVVGTSKCTSTDRRHNWSCCSAQRHSTPLIAAAFRSHLKIVEHLVEEGADIEKTDEVSILPNRRHKASARLGVCCLGQLGRTAVEFAAMGSSMQVVAFLIEHGAQINAQVQQHRH